MKNLEYLLREINILNKRIFARRQNEEQFNVFDVMLNRFDEVNLHSRFISVLLDPNGTHKKRDAFLKLFIQTLELEFEYDLSSLEIHPNEADRSEYQEIDILLRDYQKRAAIILENKINARDSNHKNEGQLERYYGVVTQKIPEERTEVIYLSINRDGPSEESVNTSGQYPDLKDKVLNIHYDEIILWLEKCAQICYDQPKLRETIIQYIQLLKIMINNITENDVAELAKIIGKDEDSLRSAKLVIDDLWKLHVFLINEFWKLLSERLRKGYTIHQEIGENDINAFLYGRPRKALELKITSKKNGCNFTIDVSPNDCICIGVSKDDVKGNVRNAKNFYSEYKSKLGLDYNDDWPFYKCLLFDENQWLYLSNIYDSLTFNLISNDNRKKTVETILRQIDEIVGKYEKYLRGFAKSDCQ